VTASFGVEFLKWSQRQQQRLQQAWILAKSPEDFDRVSAELAASHFAEAGDGNVGLAREAEASNPRADGFAVGG
jgi:hypothetical protein